MNKTKAINSQFAERDQPKRQSGGELIKQNVDLASQLEAAAREERTSSHRLADAVKRIGIVSVSLLLSSGCVVVGGYSSESGWFIWPGTFVIFLVVVLLFLLFRRRR